jgi:two-component system sensor histidine kinase BaeS
MKLVHQVSLMLLAAVLLAIVSMGALVAFNLQRGFVDYLNQRQLSYLDEIVVRLTAEAERRGSLEYLRGDDRAWAAVVNGVRNGLNRENNPPRRPPAARGASDDRAPPSFDGAPGGRRPPPPEFDDRPPPHEEGGPPDGPPGDRLPPGPGERRPPLKADPLGLGPRFHLYDANHVQMNAERGAPPDSGVPVERAIRANGKIVAYVVHTPVAREPTADDIAFLRKQFKSIGLAATGLILIALLAAPFVARRWSRPLGEISRATGRIAKGEFEVRLPDARADEIGTLMKNVNGMAQSLSKMDAARKRWIAEIAHELRTPLAVLRGEIEALQDGVRPIDQKAVASLGDEVRHLTNLVNDLHLLSLADMGGLPCIMAVFDLNPLVSRMVDCYAPRAKQAGLALSARLPDQPVEVFADDDRIEQLLSNLLENSLRYTDAPGQISIDVSRDRNIVHIRVEDSAPGVAASDCDRLFEPLFRADAARSRAAGGSGLGLAICRAIVEAHAGKIVAQPSRAGGLAVTVTLKGSP